MTSGARRRHPTWAALALFILLVAGQAALAQHNVEHYLGDAHADDGALCSFYLTGASMDVVDAPEAGPAPSPHRGLAYPIPASAAPLALASSILRSRGPPTLL